jgi:hypothetical protein
MIKRAFTVLLAAGLLALTATPALAASEDKDEGKIELKTKRPLLWLRVTLRGSQSVGRHCWINGSSSMTRICEAAGPSSVTMYRMVASNVSSVATIS